MFPSCIQCLCNLYFHISKDMHQLPCFYFSFFYLHKVFPICSYTICNCICGLKYCWRTVDKDNGGPEECFVFASILICTHDICNCNCICVPCIDGAQGQRWAGGMSVAILPFALTKSYCSRFPPIMSSYPVHE